MQLKILLLTLAALIPGLSRPAHSESCCGDCNNDGQVTLAEVQGAVNRYLGGECSIPTDTPTPTPTPTPMGATCSLPATGQTTTYHAGDDGSLQLGVPAQFVDNGDGTITDLRTGLAWEKKDDSGSLHDVNRTYVWSGDGQQQTIWDWLDAVNAEGGNGFAGHNDWRIPNANELRSFTDYGTNSPALYPPFQSACVRHCEALACSCTAPDNYWSSTTVVNGEYAFAVSAGTGETQQPYNGTYSYVRAVRGPTSQPGGCAVLKTGQYQSFQARKANSGFSTVPDDGALQVGMARSFVDNGDGTITDMISGLMWEKKGQSFGLHDASRSYAWSDVWTWLDAVNTETDPIFGDHGFAGYSDWRVPNINELLTILGFPSTIGVFNSGCSSGCSVATCSCTAYITWSSTTSDADPTQAWLSQNDRGPILTTKPNYYAVRAVRGGFALP